MKNLILKFTDGWIYFLLGVSFSAQAANLTKEETIDYINNKIFDCAIILLGESTMGTRSYSDMDINLVGTDLSVKYKKEIKTDFGVSLQYDYSNEVDLRFVSNVEILQTGPDWCDVSLRINCFESKCANIREVVSDFGTSSRSSPAIVLDFDVRDDKDAQRLRKAFEHLKAIVIEESPPLNESDPFD